MLKRLSLRNLKRQTGDYSIYFVTLAISLSLVHGLNLLLFSGDKIFHLEDTTFRLLMVLVSALLVFILAWLTSYMTNFILKRRSKEIAIYMTIGMNPRQIASVFVFENFCFAAFALLISFIGGTFVYQVLKAVAFHLVGRKFTLGVKLSVQGPLLTTLYFLATYGVSALRSIKTLRELTPRELLQYDTTHKNSAHILEKQFKIAFPFSILCGGFSVFVFICQPIGNGRDLPFGLLLALISIFVFFRSFPSLLTNLLQKGCWKYHPVRLIVLKAFTAKAQDMSTTLAFLTSAFTVSLFLISMTAISVTAFNYRLSLVPFTFSIITTQSQDRIADYETYVRGKYDAVDSCTYTIYQSDSTVFTAAKPGFTFYNAVFVATGESDLCISYSDYVMLRQLLGYTYVNLSENEYIIHCLPAFKKTFEACSGKNPMIRIGNDNLLFSGIQTEPLDQYDGYSNGAGVLLVVPDSSVAALQPCYVKYSVRIHDDTFSQAQYQEMQQAFPKLTSLRSNDNPTHVDMNDVDYIDLYNDIMQANGVLYSTSAIPTLFVAIILATAGFTVIASNLLSEKRKAAHDFFILKSIGYDQRMLEKVTFYQLVTIFVTPLAVAIVISFCISLIYAQNSGASFLVPFGELLSSYPISLMIFLLLYAIYFVLCFTTLRKTILLALAGATFFD